MTEKTSLAMNDVDYLLILPIVVLIFSAYEIGAVTLRRWHTISYYAARNHKLGYAIIGLFFLGGLSGGLWFAHHIHQFIPQ